MSDDERDRLLPKDDEGIRSASNTRTKWCFIFKLSIVLMLFKGCEEMFNTTVKQYIFAWCENFPSGQQNPGLDATNGTENDTECGVKDETVAQKMASRWELYLNLFNAVLVYFSVSIGGTLSDHYGRKVFFCLALFGWLLRCGGTSVVVYFDLHIAWMFLGYGADGVFGSLYMIGLITFASTADSTNGANERVFGITVMESVLGVGKLTTQFGNGYFIHRFGYFYPMLTATAGTLLSLIVAMATINEPQTEASALYDRPKPPLPSFRTFFRRYIGFYIDSDSEQKRTFSWICLIAFFLIMVSTLSRSDPLILYQLGSPFCWTSELIGWYNALYIFATLIVGCFLLRLLQYCISDPVIACVGTVSAILYSVLTGLAHSTEALFAAIGLGLLMELPKSILRGMASSSASSHLQGAMFAGLESSELICKMISSPTSLSLYAATVVWNPGLVFIVLGGVYGLSLIFQIYLCYLLKQQKHSFNVQALKD